MLYITETLVLLIIILKKQENKLVVLNETDKNQKKQLIKARGIYMLMLVAIHYKLSNTYICVLMTLSICISCLTTISLFKRQ